MEALYFCDHFINESLVEKFQSKVLPTSARDLFNPSLYMGNDVDIFAIRGIVHSPTDKQKGNFNLLSWIVKDEDLVCLDHLWSDVKCVYDPKIFHLNDGIYVSFNTASERNNSLYVARVHPEIEEPIEVKFPERNSIEKNWAFYEFEDQRFCLYSINPLVILKDVGNWNFETYFTNKKNTNYKNDFSIGTQFIPLNDKYLFISHEKITHDKKMFYTGKFMTFDHKERKISMGKKNWCHNIISSTDNYVKRKVYGVTYFSGIQKCENKINVSYGINDRDWSISSIPIEKIGLSDLG